MIRIYKDINIRKFTSECLGLSIGNKINDSNTQSNNSITWVSNCMSLKYKTVCIKNRQVIEYYMIYI